MNVQITIDRLLVGTVAAKIIDESMGVIGGLLIPNANYLKYKTKIQALCGKGECANSENFNIQAFDEYGNELVPVGGIIIAHMIEFDDEITVDIAGLHWKILEDM